MNRKRAAIYARISTHEGKQHLKNQLDVCREFIRRSPELDPGIAWNGNGCHIPEYCDTDSGAEPNRPALRQMLKDAAALRFDVLVVFDLSRLTREGPARAFEYIQKLTSYGCEFISVNEAHFRTAGVAGELLISIAAYFASEERRSIRERIRAGITRARAQGKILGRPTHQINPARLLALKKAGLSIRQIAAALDCSRSSVQRRMKKL